jgi:hypothetical protein
MDPSPYFPSISVIILHLTLLIEFERGPQNFTKLNGHVGDEGGGAVAPCPRAHLYGFDKRRFLASPDYLWMYKTSTYVRRFVCSCLQG